MEKLQREPLYVSEGTNNKKINTMAKKTATTVKAKNPKEFDVEMEPVIMDGEAFTPYVGENDFPKFHDFKTNPKFIGIYEDDYEFVDEEKEIDIKAHQFKSATGQKVLINKNYAINKAIEENGKKKYCIIYKGQKKLDGGRKVNEYDILTAPAVNV